MSCSVKIKVVSGAVIAALVLASGVIGYANKGNKPSVSVTEDEYGEPSHYTDVFSHEDLSPSDTAVSQSDSAPVTSDPVADKPPSPVEELLTKKFIRISKNSNMRAEDKEGSRLVTVLQKGTEAEYLSESKTRFEVKAAGGKTGWILKSCGEIFEKEVVVKHVPDNTTGIPISIKGTKESEDIAALLRKYTTMGASLAIIKDGKIAYTYEYGYADKKKNIKVSQDTKFRIASVSKVVTSMLAMTEVDDGKLDLDGNLTDLMGYKFYNPTYPKEKVTMRMLLTHTSGLIDRENEFTYRLKNITKNGDFYVSPPGVKWLYCNLGMGIAGAVVEKAAGQTLSEYAKDKLFEPMGVDASYDAKYLSDKSLVANCYTGNRVNCSSSYLCRSQERGKPGETFHIGQGGLLISSVDMAKVATLLINDGQYEGKQYLSQSSVDEMLKVNKVETKKSFSQCIALRKSDTLVKGREMYFHNGASYGIFSLAAFDKSDKSGFVIITSGAFSNRNQSSAFAVCEDVIRYTYQNILK